MLSKTREFFRKYTTDDTFDRIKEYDSISEMWEHCVKQYADTVAIEDDGNKYTYAMLEADAARFRTLIRDEGENAAANPLRIGILAANSYDFAKVFIAVTTLGYTAVVLPAQLDAASVFGCCMKFGINKLVYQPQSEERVSILAQKNPAVTLIKTDESASALTPVRQVEGKTPCVIMFTGGTTGKSKGALLSNTAVMQGVINSCYGFRDVFGEKYILILPLSHIFGLIRSFLAPLYTGSTLFICRDNKNMFRDMAVFKPTMLITVPALAEMALMLSKKFKRNMLGGNMKYIVSGAAAVPPYLVEEYAKMGISLYPGYGLTESANLVSGNPKNIEKPSSVGVLYPYQEFRIVNGELWLKGKNMMDGYIGDDEANAAVYEDGWFKTGDLVRLDDEEFLYITGRLKELIVMPNGENISPAEVEASFNALPCVRDSQVFEDINEFGAHILALEVVPRMNEIAGIPEEQIESYIRAELEKVNAALPAFQRVSRITVRKTDFERTPSMKIVRYKKCK